MEKNNMYPNMPELPGVPDAPPSYNQTYATAPEGEMASSFSGPTPMQPPHQQQQFVQQPQFIQQQPQAIIFQPAQPPIPPLGPRPCMVTCPNCHEQRMSNVIMETCMKTHLIAGLLCLVGCFCCACIPYCVDSCKNPNHYCSNCNAYLGTYNK